MKKITILAALLLSLSPMAKAEREILVIAQVEDTLKVSHAQHFWDSLNYVRDTKSRFLGMNEALRLFLNSNPQASVVYITLSQELVAGQMQIEFLRKNNFPPGTFFSYPPTEEVGLRLETLRTIMKSVQPKRVLLLGHNGGLDIEVYDTLVNEYPSIEFLSYLHMVYSTYTETEIGKLLRRGQVGYVTAVEWLLDLEQKKLISTQSLKDFAQTFIPRIMNEKTGLGKTRLPSQPEEIAIPAFVNCENFRWRWELTEELDFIAPLKSFLLGRCTVSGV